MSSISVADLPHAAELAPRFARREPFRHLVIDDFLPRPFADALLAQFPDFARGNARNETGELGGKSVVERIRELGPAYVALDDLIQTRGFLDWLSAATGIPDLLYDPWYFGGGTHDNRHGQDLDPHVDFNRHPENGWHRRLNLIVYLNHEWEDAWGGSLELHTDPRTANDVVTLVTPLFNRCVVFETTEWSWHGFSRIDLPADRRDLSRRSVALYFYTRQRPEEELAPTHSTIYVDRPLPAHLQAGHTLTGDDMAALHTLLTRRDMHNQRLYEEVKQLQARLGTPGEGHLRRLANGLREIARQRRADGLSAAGIKTAMLPFVHHLPALLRNPARRLWRALNTRG
ncbi:MAG: 2OG-Fe(II) oxygenase [Lysobacteraceae bacterium]